MPWEWVKLPGKSMQEREYNGKSLRNIHVGRWGGGGLEGSLRRKGQRER